MDLSIFATPEAWISLLTLMFLEVVLGVDNIVFISITTNRLAPEHRHIGRKLGLLGAMISRCIFLCFASYLVHMTKPLFTLDLGFFQHAFNVRDLVLLAGGAYLIYKGIDELRDVLALTEEKAEHSEEHKQLHRIGLGQAIATIMVMDLVFSIDSVITAVGLAEHLIIMVMAVIFAIVIMMVFIDAIADFINRHTEMKILALVFITVIGLLLFFDSLASTPASRCLTCTWRSSWCTAPWCSQWCWSLSKCATARTWRSGRKSAGRSSSKASSSIASGRTASLPAPMRA